MVFKNEILCHDSIHLKRKVKKNSSELSLRKILPYKYFSERVAMVTGILSPSVWPLS